MLNCLLLVFTFNFGIVLFFTCSEKIKNSNKLLSIRENHTAKNVWGGKGKSLEAGGIIIETINGLHSINYKSVIGMKHSGNAQSKITSNMSFETTFLE